MYKILYVLILALAGVSQHYTNLLLQEMSDFWRSVITY